MTDIPAYSRARGLLRNDGEPYDIEDICDLVDDQQRHLDAAAANEKWLADKVVALEKELGDVKDTIANQRMMSPSLWSRVMALGYVAKSGNPVVWMIGELEKRR